MVARLRQYQMNASGCPARKSESVRSGSSEAEVGGRLCRGPSWPGPVPIKLIRLADSGP